MNYELCSLFISQVFISYAAAEAVFSVAIFFFQLNQSLRITCRLHVESALLPETDDVVVFCFQLFQQVEGSVAECLMENGDRFFSLRSLDEPKV